MTLVAHLPELGKLNRKQIAALAGLAAFNRDNGTLRGSRCIWGGRAEVRRGLYMAMVAGVRSNPAIRTFYFAAERARARMRNRRLPPASAKLLVILNAMLRNNTHWQTPVLATSASTISPLAAAVSQHGCY
jgi:transposase